MTDQHHTLLTLDTHIDIPWPDRADFGLATDARQVGLPKMREGGLKAVFLAAYIPQGRRNGLGRDQAWHRVCEMLDVINSIPAGVASGEVRICGTAQDVRNAVSQGVAAIVPAVENGYAIGQDISRIVELHRKGVRYITLTHNGHNDLADAAIPRQDLDDPVALHNGLSTVGREAIALMNDCGIMVDVSHASRATMLQAVELSRTPIVASHSCARALCDHPRNLDDEQIDRLAERGGVVQVTAMSSFLKPSREGRATVDDLATHVAYIASRVGVAHVGVSSDFDGGGGIEGWADASQSGAVTEALLRRGFSQDELRLIWGENFLRVFEEAEQSAL